MRHTGLIALAALLLLAAACGGGGDAGDTASDAASAAADVGSGPTGGVSDAASETASEELSEAPSEAASASGEASEARSEPGGAQGDGTMAVGTLLPETGSLAFLGPPMFAGVELAVEDVNAAGGVLGTDITSIRGDSGDTTTDIASQTTDRLLGEGADAIIGAASSGVSLTVIDAITGGGVVQFSPANTATDFTDYADDGLYFRTAPSDVLQGQVLGELIIEDGNATLGILALQDAYGEGLAQFVTESFEGSGGQVVESIIYDPNAPSYDAEVQQIVAADPDAIIVIGFDESARIITSLIENGVGPGEKAVYGSDGNMGNALGEQFGDQAGALEGMKGTTPLTPLGEDFQERLLEVDPELVDFNYSGESYDAVVIIALAAEIADTDAAAAFAEEISGVTRDGEPCADYAACLELVQAGEDIDYDGVIGPIEMSDAGDPTVASYGVLTFGPDNVLVDPPEFREAELDAS